MGFVKIFNEIQSHLSSLSLVDKPEVVINVDNSGLDFRIELGKIVPLEDVDDITCLCRAIETLLMEEGFENEVPFHFTIRIDNLVAAASFYKKEE